jgi:hypothetical protein
MAFLRRGLVTNKGATPSLHTRQQAFNLAKHEETFKSVTCVKPEAKKLNRPSHKPLRAALLSGNPKPVQIIESPEDSQIKFLDKIDESIKPSMDRVMIGHVLSEAKRNAVPAKSADDLYWERKERIAGHRIVAKQSSNNVKTQLQSNQQPSGQIMNVAEVVTMAADPKVFSHLVKLTCGHIVYSKSIFQGFCSQCK